VMLWNVIKTATNGKPTNILIPAVKAH
jgi:hypothetical protein